MSEKIIFTEKEQELFLNTINYFIKAEEKEIEQLKLPGGNNDFIPKCEERLKTFESIKIKFLNLNKKLVD
jgi:hypothetical protein